MRKHGARQRQAQRADARPGRDPTRLAGRGRSFATKIWHVMKITAGATMRGAVSTRSGGFFFLDLNRTACVGATGENVHRRPRRVWFVEIGSAEIPLAHLIRPIVPIQKRIWYHRLGSFREWVLTRLSSPGQNLPCLFPNRCYGANKMG